jgi:hypothetical protein
LGVVRGEAEKEPVENRGDYADYMTCTSYASVSGTSEYWTQIIETYGVRRFFGSLVNVEEGKARRGVRIASELPVKHPPITPLSLAEGKQGVTSIFTKYVIR